MKLDTIFFIAARILVIVLALYLSYVFVQDVIEPYVFRPNCLTQTNTCVSATVYKYKNSFLAQILPSEIWVWFNGKVLYVYGQAPGQCANQETFEVVDAVQITRNSKGSIEYKRGNYECIVKVDAVFNYYKNVLKSSAQTVYFKTDKSNPNIITIFNKFIQEGIVKI
jgi:hypothetical protein